MISALDISTSGLIAQRERLTTISQNIANMSSLRDANGRIGPYRAKHVVLETDHELATTSGAAGVKVAEVRENAVEPKRRWQPDHPLAIKDGKCRVSQRRHDRAVRRCPGGNASLRIERRCD